MLPFTSHYPINVTIKNGKEESKKTFSYLYAFSN